MFRFVRITFRLLLCCFTLSSILLGLKVCLSVCQDYFFDAQKSIDYVKLISHERSKLVKLHSVISQLDFKIDSLKHWCRKSNSKSTVFCFGGLMHLPSNE